MTFLNLAPADYRSAVGYGQSGHAVDPCRLSSLPRAKRSDPPRGSRCDLQPRAQVTDEMFLAAKPRPANVLADVRAAMYEPECPSYA